MIDLVYGGLLAIFHFFSNTIDSFLHKYRDQVISFGAGVSIAYLFLVLFPELYKVQNAGPYLFATVLIGFSLFHVAEKHVYQHKSKKRLLKELKEVHSVALFIYHFLLGITIFFFTQGSFISGLLFFVPIFLHAIASNISFAELHEHFKEKTWAKLLSASAPVLGVLLPRFIDIPEIVFSVILAFVVGALLYVVVRDSIPDYCEGNVHYYLFGVAIMLVLIISTLQI